MVLLLALGGLLQSRVLQSFTPVDTDCIHWVHVGAGPPPPPSKHPPPMATKLVVGHQLMGDGSTSYEEICTKVDGSKLGHRNGNDVRDHVYGSCWIYDHEQIGRDYWLATYNKKNLTWEPFSAGMKPPTNSYKIAGLLVGRNHGNETNACTHPESPYCVKGNVMPGRVTTNPNGTLAGMDYDDYGTCHVKTYMLACCGSCAHTYWKCSHDDHTCISVSNASKTDNITVFATQQECAAKCIAPPPPPLSKNPCIRFGHVIPVGHHVDVQIVQEEDPTITFTWTNMKFSQFSDWVNIFMPGKGTITVWENVGGTRGAQLYQLTGIPLTPGPLVVVVKVAASQAANATGYWPPSLPDSIETIAASYVQGSTGSKARLFNLSPDTKSAGMTLSGKKIATNIAYSLGSEWQPVPTAADAFGFTDDLSNKLLTQQTITPAAAPIGNTNVLLGLQSGAGGAYAVQAISLQDAPEGGTCHP